MSWFINLAPLIVSGGVLLIYLIPFLWSKPSIGSLGLAEYGSHRDRIIRTAPIFVGAMLLFNSFFVCGWLSFSNVEMAQQAITTFTGQEIQSSLLNEVSAIRGVVLFFLELAINPLLALALILPVLWASFLLFWVLFMVYVKHVHTWHPVGMIFFVINLIILAASLWLLPTVTDHPLPQVQVALLAAGATMGWGIWFTWLGLGLVGLGIVAELLLPEGLTEPGPIIRRGNF